MKTINVNVKRFARQFQYSVLALLLVGAIPSRIQAQDHHSHKTADRPTGSHAGSSRPAPHPSQSGPAGDRTIQGCVRGPSRRVCPAIRLCDRRRLRGNGPALCKRKPGERRRFGCHPSPDRDLRAHADRRSKTDRRRLLVIADTWNANTAPPQLMGQLFHLFPAPNRFGLPAFYTLHVWAWKQNPKGAFVNWHPNVSCAVILAAPKSSGRPNHPENKKETNQ